MSRGTAATLGLQGTLLVHLNLNRGSLESAERPAVIAGQYTALFELLAERPYLRLALEASGHTLERIERLAPEWLAQLRALCAAGRVELVGSGDTKLVGPLVPAAVNRWNQVLGRETYQRLLGCAPRVALVSHLAWSQGLVDAYLDAGYEALVAGWSEARRLPAGGAAEWRTRPAWTHSPTGRRIRLLLADCALAHGVRGLRPGEAGVEALAGVVLALGAAPEAGRSRHVLLYAEDAAARGPEAPEAPGPAWRALGALCDRLRAGGLCFTTPARVLDDARFAPEHALELADGEEPVPVLEPPGSGLARWALGGWDAVGVNARCFARAKELERVGGTARDWQLLCRAWGSDLRADLCEPRWRRFARSLPPATPHAPGATAFSEAPLRSRRVERAGKRLALGTDGVRAVLNLRRGLALDALAFVRTGDQPLLGTRPFAGPRSPEAVAEHTSGHVVLERAGEARVTDLVPVEPEVEELTHCIAVRAAIPTALGPLLEEVRVYAQRIELRYGLADWAARPEGSLRVGALTLLDGPLDGPLFVSCANGGARERLALVARADAGRGASTRVDTLAFGATDGWLALDDGRAGFEVCWPQEEAAVLPLIVHRHSASARFVRLVFSLAEPDPTQRPGAPLPDFRLSIRPYRNRR